VADERPTKPGLRRPSVMGVPVPAREVDVRTKRDAREDPSSCPPPPSEDERQAARSMRVRAHEPPVWLVALGKWLAPLLTPVFLALGMWAQAKATEAQRQADAAADERKQAQAQQAEFAKKVTALEADNARLWKELADLKKSQGEVVGDWADFLRDNPDRRPKRKR
jgi:hypothetical protein